MIFCNNVCYVSLDYYNPCICYVSHITKGNFHTLKMVIMSISVILNDVHIFLNILIKLINIFNEHTCTDMVFYPVFLYNNKVCAVF